MIFVDRVTGANQANGYHGSSPAGFATPTRCLCSTTRHKGTVSSIRLEMPSFIPGLPTTWRRSPNNRPMLWSRWLFANGSLPTNWRVAKLNRRGLAKLLKAAITRGVACPRRIRYRRQSIFSMCFPILRNELAYGSTHLMPYGTPDILRLGFEIICKLFPDQAGRTPARASRGRS